MDLICYRVCSCSVDYFSDRVGHEVELRLLSGNGYKCDHLSCLNDVYVVPSELLESLLSCVSIEEFLTARDCLVREFGLRLV